MKLTSRLVTIICYFFPFTFFLTTCNNPFEWRFSYNRAEADKNIALENESSKIAADTAQYDPQSLQDTTNTNAVAQNLLKDTTNIYADTSQNLSDYSDIILRKIIMPTDSSLSGIGAVFYFKNLTGQIAIAISLLTSLVLFIAFRFLKSRMAKLYLLLTAVLCLAIFIIDSFVSNVTLLWGSWTLLVLLLFQLIVEFNEQRNASQ
jgi:hypothetical protein